MKAASFSFILKAEVPLVFRVETPKQVSISSPTLRYKEPDYMNTGPFTLPAAILNHELPSALDLQQAVAPPPVKNRGQKHCWGKGDASVSKKTEARGKVVGLPWWLRGKESACNAGKLRSIPGLGKSSGEGKGYPLQYSCLENPMDRGAWRATIHGVAKSRT